MGGQFIEKRLTLGRKKKDERFAVFFFFKDADQRSLNNISITKKQQMTVYRGFTRAYENTQKRIMKHARAIGTYLSK